MLYFNNEFWSEIIKSYDESTKKDKIIKIYKDLGNIFEKYYKLVNDISKSKTIKIKAKEFKEKDELSSKLDKNIIDYIKEKNDIKIDEIVDLLINYDPYYQEDIYINKRNPEVLEKLDIEKFDEDFIKFYREKNFELVFKNQIDDYILKMTSKIEKISHFITIIKLFNIDNIGNKKNDFIRLLERKYDFLIKKIKNFSEESLKEKESKEMIENLTELLYFFYDKCGLESFKNKVKNLNQPLLAVEIYINLYKKF